MNRRSVGWLAIAALAALLLSALPAPTAQTQDRAEAALKAAMDKETLEGDVKGAIEQYKKLAQSGNKPVAARALVRLGECYEKQGNADARKTYEQVLSKFGDQKDAVEQARARLAALGGAAKGVVSERRLWVGDSDNVEYAGRPSADGRFLPYVQWMGKGGDVMLRDLVTGQVQNLTRGGPDGDSASVVMSPDGRLIAYTFFLGPRELRVMNADGTAIHTLFAKPNVVPEAFAWSPDSRRILARLSVPPGFRPAAAETPADQLVSISLADGAVQVIKSVPGLLECDISPDGKQIASVRMSGDKKRSIVLMSADGATEIPLLSGSGEQWGPLWTPDGHELLFRSNRSGKTDLLAIRVRDGKPEGEPRIVKANTSIEPLAFARDGSLFYRIGTSSRDLFLADLDASGKVTSGRRRLNQHFEGASGGRAIWSADGEQVAYNVFPEVLVLVRSMLTGNEREIPGTEGLVPVAWMPDGRSILARASGSNEQTLLRIDVQTGEKEESMRLPIQTGRDNVAVSRDGKAVYYSQGGRLMRRNLETRRDDEITREGRKPYLFLSISPDGRLLAFACHPNLCLVPAEGGAIRELRPGPEYFVGAINWSKDGKHIIAPAYEKGGLDRTPVRLWSVPLDGGPAELAEPPQARDQGLFFGSQTSVSPDSTKVAFEWNESKSELWVLENFLPAAKGAPAAK